MVMFINLCVINVGASVKNHSVLCYVFSYVQVDIIFIADSPVNSSGDYVIGNVGEFVYVSGLEICDVQVYGRGRFQGLFDLLWTDGHGVILRVMSRGVVRKIGGIYLHPGLGNADVELALAPFVAYDILTADFNAIHDRWAHVVDVGGHNQEGTVVARIQSGMDVMVQLVLTHDGISVIDLYAFKLPPVKYCVSQLTGLPHAAQIVKFDADTVGLPAPKPGYKRPRWDIVGSDLQSIDPSGDNIWQEATHVVDALPRTHHGKSSYHWWNNDLENIRNDVRRLR